MATLAELEKAIQVAREAGASDESQVDADMFGSIVIATKNNDVVISFDTDDGLFYYIDVFMRSWGNKVGDSLFISAKS